MFWTIVVTIAAGVLYYFTKKKRDETGAVKTPQGYAFAITGLLAIILWIGQILGIFC